MPGIKILDLLETIVKLLSEPDTPDEHGIFICFKFKKEFKYIFF